MQATTAQKGTFTHTPRPAITTDRPGCAWQRRFGNASDPLGYELTASTDRERATITEVLGRMTAAGWVRVQGGAA